MAKRIAKGLVASVLLIAVLVPAASALIGETPARWTFEFDDQGVWHATGEHVSFAWTLKPFEVYDYMVDGVLLIEEISFPADASDYMADGATLQVMMGDDLLASFEDNSNALIDLNCDGLLDASGAASSCDLEFPEGSEIVGPDRTQGAMSRFTAELPAKAGAIAPCVNIAIKGTTSIEGAMIMFVGDAHLRLLNAGETDPPEPDRWTFTFDDQGAWHATGQHVSFAWTLKPFEVYDLMVDGVMLIDELTFPADADDFMTEGATFKVMMGGQTFFSIQDNGVSNMRSHCVIGPNDSCHLEFPEGSEVMPMAAGKGQMSLFHVEYEGVAGGVVPCGTMGVRGEVSVDMSMVMFAGDLHLHYPVGQSMILVGL